MSEPGPTLPGANPLDVACPDCAVPAGTPCAFSGGYEGVHADRQRTADLHALEQGTCALCGQFMVRGSVEGAPPDAWHPDPADAAACPPIPSPEDNYEAWATAVNLGLTPGHPGIEQFVPVHDVPDLTGPARGRRPDRAATLVIPIAPGAPICPECAAGKHDNCDGTAWDTDADQSTRCACAAADHPGSTP